MRFTDGAAVLAAVGSPLGHSSWHVVTASDVASYGASVTGAAGPGPNPAVVPGGLTLGLAAVFLAELLAVDGYVGVDYGLDRVRSPVPLLVGTPLRARGLLVGARCEGDAVRTVSELTYEVEGAGRTPCVAQVVTLLLPTT